MFSSLRAAASWRHLLGSSLAALALSAHSADPGLSYERALQLAQEQSAMLRARRASAEGASALEVSAAQLPDPKLAAGIDNLPINSADRFSLTRDFMTMRQIGWMQDMPNADKRKARGEIAAARTSRERAQLASERVMVERGASQAWLARYYAEQRLSAFGALDAENRLLRDTVNARVASGRAMPADAAMVRQESVALDDRRDELERDVAKARAALRRWLGNTADEPLSGEPPSLQTQIDKLRGDTASGRLERHAELVTFAPMIEMARAEGREAEAAKKGDWSWGVMLSKRGPAFSDMVSLQVSFELPLWADKRQDPQIEARRKDVERIEAEREEMRRRLVLEIETQLAEEAELERKLARLRSRSVPLAEERVSLTLASYQAGRGDLGAVLASRKELVETRLRAIDIAAQRAALRAQLNTHFLKDHP